MLSNYPLELINPKSYDETLQSAQKIFKEYEIQMKSRVSFEVVKVSIGYPLFKWDEKNQEHIQKTEKEINEKREFCKNLIRQRQKSKYFETCEEQRN
jgi:hypothetical protein